MDAENRELLVAARLLLLKAERTVDIAEISEDCNLICMPDNANRTPEHTQQKWKVAQLNDLSNQIHNIIVDLENVMNAD